MLKLVQTIKRTVMKKFIGILTSVIVLIGLSASSPALIQKRVDFEVRIGSRVLGDFVVIKQQLGDREDFVIEQIIEDGLLHKSKVHYRVHSQYKAAQLQVMEMQNVVDEVVLQSSDLQLKEGIYHLNTDLGTVKVPAEDMVRGSAYIFFEEPSESGLIFHEKYGQILSITRTGDHVYEIALPNGGREVYTYTDGRLNMFMIEKTFGMFSMTLKEPLAKG